MFAVRIRGLIVLRVLSLGAGVQSSTLFLKSCFGEIEHLDCAIFADTGFEPQEVYNWLAFLMETGDFYGIPVHIVKYRDLYVDSLIAKVRGNQAKGERWSALPFYVTNLDGSGGMLRRQCTYNYKIFPIQQKLRELVGYKKYARIPSGLVEVWKGISLDEIKRVVLSSDKWIYFDYPLVELGMTRYDCLRWFEKKNLPSPPRSSCLGCPYRSNSEWRHLKLSSPEEWQKVVFFDRKIRSCGDLRGQCFVHPQRIPLEDVDLRTMEDRGQLNMFRDECQGVCGV